MGRTKKIGATRSLGTALGRDRERPPHAEGHRAIRLISTGAAFALLAGCACSDDEARTRPQPRAHTHNESLTPDDSLADETLAPCCEPEERPVIVRNRTDAPIELDTTDGAAAFVGIADERGHFGRLALEHGADECACPCDPSARCAECEPPPARSITVAPGGEYEITWNGRARRWMHDGDGEICFETAGPPAGRYFVRVCGRDVGGCTTARVRIPSSDSIVLTLAGNTQRMDSCPADNLIIERAARLALYQMRLGRAGVDRLQGCAPSSAECSLPGAVSTGEVSACTLRVLPSGEELEARVLLPPLAGAEDANRFSVFFDTSAVTVRRVQFAR